MKIVIDKDIPFIKGLFEPFAQVVYLAGKDILKNDIMDADALIVRTRTKCNEALLKDTAVKYIASATIGTDHIDTAWCDKNGIKWSNAAGCNSYAVTQYVVCALLQIASSKNIDLKNKVLGIVGVGNIGSKVKIAAEALGMKVLLNDPPRAEYEANSDFVSLAEIAKQADFITFHVPLTTSGSYTTNLMAGECFFNLLKNKPFIINSSRGEVIDENAIIKALKNKVIQGAVIDVWNNEPNINQELLNLVDIATFHIAGYSVQGKINATVMSANSVASFFNIPKKFNIEAEIPANNIITLKESNFQNLLQQAMEATYSIMYDDRLLRENMADFEKLRSEYNYRFEPVSYVVDIKNMGNELKNTLQALRFKMSN